MEMIKEAILDWLREILVGGIVSNLSGMFDNVNQRVGEIATQVGTTPAAWNGTIYGMVRNLSESVILPIAGVILAFVMTLELIQMVTEKNNMHGDIDTFMFFKWVFKTAAAVLIVTNTWNIVMGVFDMAQSVVNSAAGVIVSDASIDISTVVVDLEARLMEMEVGALFGLWFQSLFVGITMWAHHTPLFITVGEMIEIYLVTPGGRGPSNGYHGVNRVGVGQWPNLVTICCPGFQAFLILSVYAIIRSAGPQYRGHGRHLVRWAHRTCMA